ncbi:MAG: DUF3820 family protein [Cyanobacterium sp. T60_A2020_053]|nr:DUF3820 family protein [Cyanobacterium sp. T60_A2020_053]
MIEIQIMEDDTKRKVLINVDKIMIINFGKYKGQHLEDLPPSYKIWLYENLDKKKYSKLINQLEYWCKKYKFQQKKQELLSRFPNKENMVAEIKPR